MPKKGRKEKAKGKPICRAKASTELWYARPPPLRPMRPTKKRQVQRATPYI